MEVNLLNLEMNQILTHEMPKEIEGIIMFLIKCSVCDKICLPPYTNKGETSYFCKGCVSQSGTEVKLKVFSILEKSFLEKLTCVCKYQQFGCTSSFSYNESIEKLESHQNLCEYRIVNCPDCNVSINFINSRDHEEQCEEKSMLCNNCKTFYKKNIPHQIEDCVQNINQKYQNLSVKLNELEQKSRWKKRILKKNKLKKANKPLDIIIRENVDLNDQDKEIQELKEKGLNYLKINNYFEAIKCFQTALGKMLTKFGEDNCKLKEIYIYLSTIYEDVCKYDSALEYYEKLLKIIDLEKKDNIELSDFLSRIGSLYLSLNKFDLSETYYKKSYDLRKSMPNNSVKIMMSCLELGLLYHETGQYKKALEYFDLAEKIKSDKTLLLALIYDGVGETHMQLGDNNKAYEYYMKSFEIREKVNRDNNLELTLSYDNIALYYCEQKNFNKAIENIKKSKEIRKRCRENKGLATSYYHEGYIYTQIGEFNKALKKFNRSLDIRKNIYGETHKEVGKIYQQLGIIKEEQCKYEESISYQKIGLEIFQRIFGGVHNEIANSWFNLGSVHTSLEDIDMALKCYEKSICVRKLMDIENSDMAETYDMIGMIFNMNKEYKNSIHNYEKALNIRKRIFGESNIEIAKSYENIASSNIELRRKNNDKTIKYLTIAINIRKVTNGENSKEMAENYFSLGLCWYKLFSNQENALKNFEHSKKIAQDLKNEEIIQKCNDQLKKIKPKINKLGSNSCLNKRVTETK